MAIAPALGRMPAFLFEDLQTVWIHDGVELWGGGNNNLLVHTGQSVNYAADGVLDLGLVLRHDHLGRHVAAAGRDENRGDEKPRDHGDGPYQLGRGKGRAGTPSWETRGLGFAHSIQRSYQAWNIRTSHR